MLNNFSHQFLKLNIEKSLKDLVNNFLNGSIITREYPLISRIFEDFSLREGKRIRSILFAYAYLSIKHTAAPNLFHSAASLELLHLFALIHDDVIDSSDFRRGQLSLHNQFHQLFTDEHSGKCLALIIGDTLFGYAISCFLQVHENSFARISSLQYLLDAGVNTGNGQALEILNTQLDVKNISLDDILKVYDNKTAAYTFCGPLVAGARLAGAENDALEILRETGIYLGRAYQMLDDLYEAFESIEDNKIPQDWLANRKNILQWHLYNFGDKPIRELIECNKLPTVDHLQQAFAEFNSFTYISQLIITNIKSALSTAVNFFSEEQFVTFEEFIVVIFQPILDILKKPNCNNSLEEIFDCEKNTT
jgi:geranylgeranyl pyrophosphate synthase